jgi:hypothetical protein
MPGAYKEPTSGYETSYDRIRVAGNEHRRYADLQPCAESRQGKHGPGTYTAFDADGMFTGYMDVPMMAHSPVVRILGRESRCGDCARIVPSSGNMASTQGAGTGTLLVRSGLELGCSYAPHVFKLDKAVLLERAQVAASASVSHGQSQNW